ncbi:hypothetical protein I4F81_002865 [Pyropia yezoensis]|uniref:Uncharacterized protein n=1 Tax=Pyropia yezoensis TaxID=2788 RepID=A0ACC3BRD6_PYRYE|nr:hypothetical protein I4F81_002865 [Neopyropia yezoensis]
MHRAPSTTATTAVTTTIAASGTTAVWGMGPGLSASSPPSSTRQHRPAEQQRGVRSRRGHHHVRSKHVLHPRYYLGGLMREARLPVGVREQRPCGGGIAQHHRVAVRAAVKDSLAALQRHFPSTIRSHSPPPPFTTVCHYRATPPIAAAPTATIQINEDGEGGDASARHLPTLVHVPAECVAHLVPVEPQVGGTSNGRRDHPIPPATASAARRAQRLPAAPPSLNHGADKERAEAVKDAGCQLGGLDRHAPLLTGGRLPCRRARQAVHAGGVCVRPPRHTLGLGEEGGHRDDGGGRAVPERMKQPGRRLIIATARRCCCPVEVARRKDGDGWHTPRGGGHRGRRDGARPTRTRRGRRGCGRGRPHLATNRPHDA